MSQSTTGDQGDYRLAYEAVKAELAMLLEIWKQVQAGEATVADFTAFIDDNF